MSKDRKVFFLASGGRDSTALILEAFRLGIEGEMICANTYYNRRESLATLDDLRDYTGYKLIHAKYKYGEGDDPPGKILRDAFLVLNRMDWVRNKGGSGYRKQLFYCCNKLKHKPMTLYMRQFEKTDIVRVMGIKGGDGSFWRRYWLKQLRDQGRFWREMHDGYRYYYPLRDCKKKDVNFILDEHGFANTKSSGCRICPIFVLFPSLRNADMETWARSTRFADQLGIEHDYSGQTRLTEFCPDMEISMKQLKKEIDEQALTMAENERGR